MNFCTNLPRVTGAVGVDRKSISNLKFILILLVVLIHSGQAVDLSLCKSVDYWGVICYSTCLTM